MPDYVGNINGIVWFWNCLPLSAVVWLDIFASLWTNQGRKSSSFIFVFESPLCLADNIENSPSKTCFFRNASRQFFFLAFVEFSLLSELYLPFQNLHFDYMLRFTTWMRVVSLALGANFLFVSAESNTSALSAPRSSGGGVTRRRAGKSSREGTSTCAPPPPPPR